MIQTHAAIVLRPTPFQEGGLVVSFLTEHGERLVGLAKGAKKPAAKWVSSFEPLGLVKVAFFGKEHTELKRRQHQRFSVMCPGVFALEAGGRRGAVFAMQVIECSRTGFRARCDEPVPLSSEGFAAIDLGLTEHCRMRVRVLRRAHADDRIAMFRIVDTDLVWRKFVSALLMASTHGDLSEATRFLEV